MLLRFTANRTHNTHYTTHCIQNNIVYAEYENANMQLEKSATPLRAMNYLNCNHMKWLG